MKSASKREKIIHLKGYWIETPQKISHSYPNKIRCYIYADITSQKRTNKLINYIRYTVRDFPELSSPL